MLSVCVLAVSAMGCGTGIMTFHEVNGGPPPGPAAATEVFTVDCVDTFVKNDKGYSTLGSDSGTYTVACTSDGKPFPWKVLGALHAAPMAHGKWEQYSKEAREKAQRKGCPAVAIRREPPTKNQEGEAIGALCVDPAQAAPADQDAGKLYTFTIPVVKRKRL